MLQHLKAYAQYVRLNLATWMEYRADFIIGAGAILLTNIITIVFFWTIFQHIPNLKGWTFEQLLFIYGFLSLAFGIWHVFLSGISPWKMEELVRWGELDRILLRPLHIIPHLLIRELNDDGIGNLVAGCAIILYASYALGIQWTASLVLLFVLLAASGTLILFASMLILSTISFWVIRFYSITEIFWSVTRIIEYPINIYNTAVVWILTYIFPIAFINFYPAQAFIQKQQWLIYAYATPIASLLFLAFALFVWRLGIKSYTSVGH